MKKDLNDFAKLLTEALESSISKGQSKKEVGLLSEEVIELFEEKDRLSEKLERDIKIRMAQLQAQVEDEFENRLKEISTHHKKVWDRVYRENGLDPTQEYTVDLSKKNGLCL